LSSNKKERGTVEGVKQKLGRPPSDRPKGRLRALRFDDLEDREITAALAVKGQEFSEWARPVLVTQARRDIEKARRR
jgi:hypothetical protein